MPISFEVFSDEFAQMERQAHRIAAWGDNVYVKIPVTNSRGEPADDLVRRLSAAGIRVNVTAVFTLGQVGALVPCLSGGAAAFVGLSQWDDSGPGGGTASAQPPNESMKHFVPQLGGPFEAPFPSDPEPLSCFSVAYTTGRTTLYKKPGGAVRIRLSARTDWGSPRILGVIRRRGD